MLEFTENDAFDRIEDIGQAFANDVNDGDGPVLYEGISYMDMGDVTYLIYDAKLEDNSECKFMWKMELVNEEWVTREA